MPNWASNRLTLSGPSTELERFQNTCIRVPFDGSYDGITFDLGALVPMPAVIVETLDDASPAAKQTAVDETGYESWYDWCLAEWGCKWNASGFKLITVAPDLLDVFFETPWSSPEPAFAALAAQFPLLSGRVCAVEESMEWGLIGEFREGSYSSVPVELSPELGFLVYSWTQDTKICLKAGYVLAELPDGAEPLSNAVLQIWGDLVATLAPEFMVRLHFLFDVQRFNACNDSELNTSHDLSLDDVVRVPQTRAFLQIGGRCYSPLDRGLMHLLAQDVLAAWDRQSDHAKNEVNLRRSIAYLLFEHTEDDLREWAFHAAFRPGASLNLADVASLQESFVQYAKRTRQCVLQHLEAIQAAEPLVSATKVMNIQSTCLQAHQRL